jgi:hypothetical protein
MQTKACQFQTKYQSILLLLVEVVIGYHKGQPAPSPQRACQTKQAMLMKSLFFFDTIHKTTTRKQFILVDFKQYYSSVSKLKRNKQRNICNLSI